MRTFSRNCPTRTSPRPQRSCLCRTTSTPTDRLHFTKPSPPPRHAGSSNGLSGITRPNPIQIFVEGAGVIGEAASPAFERCHDEAWIGAVQRVFAFAHDAPGPAPAFQRAIEEVAEDPRGLARAQTQALGGGGLSNKRRLQSCIARQAEHVIDAVRLAPTHQLVVGKSAVAAQDDAHAWPASPDLSHDCLL